MPSHLSAVAFLATILFSQAGHSNTEGIVAAGKADPCGLPAIADYSTLTRNRPTRITSLRDGKDTITLFALPSVAGAVPSNDVVNSFMFARGSILYTGFVHDFYHRGTQHICFYGQFTVIQRHNSGYDSGKPVYARLNGRIVGKKASMALYLRNVMYRMSGRLEIFVLKH